MGPGILVSPVVKVLLTVDKLVSKDYAFKGEIMVVIYHCIYPD
jgi:hypothetical protein